MAATKGEHAGGVVYLVGAGPGNPDLITVRGLELLRNCDVLVYDNLMADEFVALSRAPEKIYVGKASGKHMHSQEQIGRILVDRASRGYKVVRLKGGDPFVFGRGGEECQALGKAGIRYVVVPGVTAGIAGAAHAGIPVTHRELSRGVTLVTGHFSRNQQVELPWESLAGLDHTLVFYMAVAARDHVCTRLVEAGLDGQTPAALIEQATMGSQRIVAGTLDTITALGREKDVRPPALLVVGKVTALGETLAWRPVQPLAGKTVMFTRAAERDYEAVDRLRSMGAKVIDIPVVQAVRRTGDEDVERIMASLHDHDVLAFTSAAAVQFFFDALRDGGLDTRVLGSHTVVAATHTVADALVGQGIRPDLPLDVVRSKGLARALVEDGPGPGARVLVPRSSVAGRGFIDRLAEAGLHPEPLVLYDAKRADLGWLEVKLTGRRPDAVVFLSGSGVDAVLDALPDLGHLEPKPLMACVGRQTAKSLEARGLRADVVPEMPDVDRLIDDLVVKLTSTR